MIQLRTAITALLVTTFLTSQISIAATPATTQASAEMKLLVEKARATEARFLTDATRWTATISFGPGLPEVIAKWFFSSAGSRVDFSIHAGDQDVPAASIIERDGFWYVAEGGRFGKYLPYESPFVVANTPLFYELSQLRTANQLTLGGPLEFEGLNGSLATFRSPMAEPLRGQIKGRLDQLEQLAKDDPSLLKSPEMQSSLKLARDLLAHGLVARIDADTGVLIESISPKISVKWSQVQWLDKPDASALDISDHTWADHSSGPLSADPNDLVMMGHAGTWHPGTKAGDADICIVNSKTGETWRVPFEGGTAMPGCFLTDRKSVVVCGPDAESGGLNLYSVNLVTRENHRLGDQGIATGINIMPALSHDGRTLAVLHMDAAGGLLDSQILLLDLASGKTHRLGKTMDTAFISWLPDDTGLVLLKRDYATPQSQAVTSIATLNLQGELTTIRPGDAPLVLANKRILFSERPGDSDRWSTCKLDGSDAKLLGDGLKDYGFPTASPDGQHLLMMYFGNKETGPIPTILDIDGKNSRPIQLDRGLWMEPNW